MAALADLGPISPELVLVCPELKAALAEDYRRSGAVALRLVEPLPVGPARPSLELVPLPTAPVPGAPSTHPPLALVAAAYALQRLAIVVTQSVVIVALVVVVIVAIQLASM